ncbi:hypothetical protein H4R24_005304 [Coemansia sp. RSA 988]|nr:hypothetical protein H4R24_005304 [Coemansia sp. RSA 988]
MSPKRRKLEHAQDTPIHFEWPPNIDLTLCSPLSLSTDSTNVSMHSMLTPSPEPSPIPSSSNISSEETLTSSYAIGFRDPLNETTENIRTKKSANKQPDLVTNNSSPHANHSYDDLTRTPIRTSRKEEKEADSNSSSPEKLAESLRLSGSPTRVSGSKVAADINFTDSDCSGVCKVDKSLVCKGFWEAIGKAGRICLPRRSGKTYNLTQLLLFFSLSPELDYLTSIPDSAIHNNLIENGDIAELDVATKCRLKRERLFDGSLLKTIHPEFYHEHFMKYPVLNISLSNCKGESLGDFIIKLCNAIGHAVRKWIDSLELYDLAVGRLAESSFKRLTRTLKMLDDIMYLQANQVVEYIGFVHLLFNDLSDFIAKQYGRYLLLVDEYDIPFITIHLASWSKKDKQSARNILKQLFQTMLKDNRHLIKGLLFGVFEVPLTEMGSGANNIKDIRMIPAEKSDIQGSILSASHPHSGSGLDALTDSFWFNASEVRLMLDSSTKSCSQIAAHKPYIVETIREWYNGYFIGRFRGKYNPWSVSSFIESLCNLLNQSNAESVDIKSAVKSAARPYWVTTGTTCLIEEQIDRHRPRFIRIAKRLLRNYETRKFKSKNEGSQRTKHHIPLVSTCVNLIAQDNEHFSEPGLLTLCLYAGYLTRWKSTSVCIPNQEVYKVWLNMFARAVLGTEMADNSTNYKRGALLKELWRGKTELLCTLATSSHGVLTNHNRYAEKDYANHVANTLMAVSRFGMLTHPLQESVRISDAVPVRENHSGTGCCDYTMRLPSYHNVPNQFGVVIEFKLIGNANRDNREYHVKRANEGLKQIASNNYDACLVGCLERVDVGMAIGNNVVHAVTKRYCRKTVDSPWRQVPPPRRRHR